MKKHQLKQVIDALNSLQDEAPKNLKDKINTTISLLSGDEEFSIMRSKVLSELEDLSENNNLESYTRMQLLNVVSLLEGL